MLSCWENCLLQLRTNKAVIPTTIQRHLPLAMVDGVSLSWKTITQGPLDLWRNNKILRADSSMINLIALLSPSSALNQPYHFMIMRIGRMIYADAAPGEHREQGVGQLAPQRLEQSTFSGYVLHHPLMGCSKTFR